jgi:hypothetical protein
MEDEGWVEVPDVLGTGTLWRCPRCGKKYVQRNSSHSCGPHTIEAFLEGKGPRATALWERFVEIVTSLGPVEPVANRHNIGFMVRARFASVFSLSERGMIVHFWLKRRMESPRLSKREHLGKRDWIYRVRVAAPEDLDAELTAWLREAYTVGAQRAEEQA